MTTKYLWILGAFTLLLAACSIEVVDQPRDRNSPAAQEDQIDEDQRELDGGDNESDTADQSDWRDLDLTGHLVYLALVNEEQQILKLDLESGEEEIIFKVPELGWLSGAAVSKDGERMVLSYSAPPEQGQVQFGFTDLYLMPSDGSSPPEPLIIKEDPSEAFYNVSWPMDDTIYYAHVAPSADESGLVIYESQVERVDISSGDREILTGSAAWPRLAYDNSKLAYVDNDQELIISETDGTDPEIIIGADEYDAIDAPLFSQDGDLICFSAVQQQPAASSSLWENLIGVTVADAHSVPSDWWCLTRNGSEDPLQITDIGAIGLYGDFSPDGNYLAFIASDGVFIMKADGSDLRKIKEVNAFGTLDWVPVSK